MHRGTGLEKRFKNPFRFCAFEEALTPRPRVTVRCRERSRDVVMRHDTARLGPAVGRECLPVDFQMATQTKNVGGPDRYEHQNDKELFIYVETA
ncbi:hypothetical protein EVAR_49092_1 [Eumeta japonica]|uniref:Uncharacterized protein n=1 Tax=Eumeta variegata TaxID=151549 RepID=A0A4C1ZUB9_EUMVA|nr:hypothetical protein EVAR_49092_1 [Eumeta japonica]